MYLIICKFKENQGKVVQGTGYGVPEHLK